MNEIVGYDSMGNDNVPMDAQGNKTNEMGRGIDNFLRNLMGGEGVGGSPTSNLGILPQASPMGAPKLGSAASGTNLGATGNLSNAPSGDPFNESDNGKVLANAGNTRDYDATIALQNKLNAQGAGLDVDGINGPLTKAAMQKYGGGSRQPDLTSMIQLPEDTSGDPFTEADNMPVAPVAPAMPDRYNTIPNVGGPGSEFNNPTNAQIDGPRNAIPEEDNQAPIEWLLNKGGQGIDYIDDMMARGAGSVSNFGDQFISRPGPELNARMAQRQAETDKYTNAYDGNIGSKLFELIKSQQGQ